jgi:hypothetical protein
MANAWVLSAFQGFKNLGPKEGESMSGGAHPDMTHGYMWDRVMGGTEDAINALRRAEEELALAKSRDEMSGKELALLGRSVTNLRASAEASHGPNKRQLLGDYSLDGVHVHRHATAVGGAWSGMSDSPLLFQGRNGMYSVVDDMLQSLHNVRLEKGPSAGGEVKLGVEIEEIFRETGSGLYQLLSPVSGMEPKGDSADAERASEKEGGGGSGGGEGKSGSECGSDDHVSLQCDKESCSMGEFDYVCVCVPAREVPPLLRDVLPPKHFILEAAAASTSAPVWAVVMEFEHAPPFSFQGAFYQPSLRSDVDLVGRMRARRAEQEALHEKRDLQRRAKRAAIRQSRKLARELRVKEKRERRRAERGGGGKGGVDSDTEMKEWLKELDKVEWKVRLEEDEMDDYERNQRALVEEEEEVEERKQLYHALLALAGTPSNSTSTTLNVREAKLQLSLLGYSEEEVEAFEHSACLWAATERSWGTLKTPHNADTTQEVHHDLLLSAQEWELRQARDSWQHIPRVGERRPETGAWQVEEIGRDAFLSGMRNVEHTRRRLQMQRESARIKAARDTDKDKEDGVDMASFWDVTNEYYAARSAAALQRQAHVGSSRHAAAPSDAEGGGGRGRGTGETVKDGPAAVWMVFTTCQWAQENRERVPRDVAKLVSEQALHVLCRGVDEAATQRVMCAHMPTKTQATFWPDAQLTSLPASMLRNEATRKASQLAPEVRMCLFDTSRSIGVAADWVVELSVEGAWVSGQALATAVLTDVGCNVGRTSALLARELENLVDLASVDFDRTLKEQWASGDRRIVVMTKIYTRWACLLPAAKALRTWEEFTATSIQVKRLFLMCFTSNNALAQSTAWEAWEEVVTETKAKRVMKNLIALINGTILPDSLNAWVQITIGGPSWKLMMGLRKHRDALYLKKVINAWSVNASEDRDSRVSTFLPLFVLQRQNRLLLHVVEEWHSDATHRENERRKNSQKYL